MSLVHAPTSQVELGPPGAGPYALILPLIDGDFRGTLRSPASGCEEGEQNEEQIKDEKQKKDGTRPIYQTLSESGLKCIANVRFGASHGCRATLFYKLLCASVFVNGVNFSFDHTSAVECPIVLFICFAACAWDLRRCWFSTAPNSVIRYNSYVMLQCATIQHVQSACLCAPSHFLLQTTKAKFLTSQLPRRQPDTACRERRQQSGGREMGFCLACVCGMGPLLAGRTRCVPAEADL
eukprot:1158046-Pelagomonas_calceolata.AAC.5